MVSFLLNNSIRVTTPIAKFNEIADKFKNENDADTKDLFESLSKESHSYKVATGGSVDVLGIVGASGNLSTDLSGMSEDQKKTYREQFVHDLQEGSKMVKGDIPSVIAFSGDQSNPYRLEDTSNNNTSGKKAAVEINR